MSVIEQGPTGESEVAFHANDATKLEDRREAEELRRLLYVAVTRARDRLYLAAEVEPGRGVRNQGRSLASLMPDSLKHAFAIAAGAPSLEEVTWASRDAVFAFRVCRAPADHRRSLETPEPERRTGVLAAPLVTTGTRVVAATLTEAADEPSVARRGRQKVSPGAARLVGTVVHRLFQRNVDPAMAADELLALTRALVRGDEQVDVPDPVELASSAAELYRAFRQRPDVSALLSAGRCYYEVPFSYDPPSRPGERVRGSVDCLILGDDGTATVLEFKTGRPKPEHEAQARLYADALKAAFGHDRVSTHVLYA